MKIFLKSLWRLVTFQPDPFRLRELKRLREQADFWNRQCEESFARAIDYLKVSDIKNFTLYMDRFTVAKKRFDQEVSDKLANL